MLQSKWEFQKETAKFQIHNFITTGDLEAIKWTFSFDLKTGKKKLECSSKEQDLDRSSFFKYKNNVEVTKRCGFYDFIKKFHGDLQIKKQSKYFKTKKLDFSNAMAKEYNNLTVIPMSSTFNDEIKGLLFINEKTEKVYSFQIDDNVGVFLNGTNEVVYFCKGLEEGFNCENITKRKTALFLNEDSLVKSANNYASLNFNDTIIVLGSNPTKKEVLNGAIPSSYLSNFRKKFKPLNIFVKFPPETTDSDASSLGFYDYFFHSPQSCQDMLLSTEENTNFRILGFEGKSVIVFSKYLKKPKEISQTDKLSNLLLIAPEQFYLSKFNTLKEKDIIGSIFNLARGKTYYSERIRGAGIFKDKKDIIINTGKKIIGPPSVDFKYIYLKSGTFPTPKDIPINTKDFFDLKANILDTVSFNNPNEGFNIIAWSILALFSTILQARFSLHLYGDSSSGKSFTRDEVIIGLQKKFMHVVRKFIPGYTYAAFKDDLREGATVLHFEEAEGNNYDENIIKIIRASTHDLTELKQMKGQSGGTITTPINFMSTSSYNFKPAGQTYADLNRIIAVNYSTSRLKIERRQDTVKALLRVDLEALGFELFSHIYNNWKTYLENVKNNQNDPRIFGLLLNGHKRIILSELVAFYQTTGLMGIETLKTYIKFLNDKEEQETQIDFNSSFIETIGRIEVKGPDGYRVKTIRTILYEVPTDRHSDGYMEWSKWAHHIYTHYSMKVFKDASGKMYLSIPKDDWIPSQLIKLGVPRSEANSYTGIIKSKFNKVSRLEFNSVKKYCYCVPVMHFVSEAICKKWRGLYDEQILRDIYS